jgi:hypothetical protein
MVQKGREPAIGHCLPKIGYDRTQDLSLGYVPAGREPAPNEFQNGNVLILIEGQGVVRRLRWFSSFAVNFRDVLRRNVKHPSK